MSIFAIRDIDDILLSFCDIMDDFIIINQLNKYYKQLIIKNILFKSWTELRVFDRENKIYDLTKNNSLFINACDTNNLMCKYLSKKYIDIDIHANNEYAFQLSCQNGDLDLAQYLVDLGQKSNSLINIHEDNELAFRWSCQNGHLNIAEWLINLGQKSNSPINIHVADENPFRFSCKNGHLHIAQWLIDLGRKSNLLIDIHADDELAFRWSCENGHLHIAKWLIELGKKSNSLINIHMHNDYAFHWSCKNGHLHVAQWLTTLSDKYIILNSNDQEIEYQILE